MIHLTRINGKAFVLNAELIKMLEETPDTLITLINGERYIVAEPTATVIERVIEYGKRLRAFKLE